MLSVHWRLRMGLLLILAAPFWTGAVATMAQNPDYALGREHLWHHFFCIREETCATGDFNGDGLDDIVAFVRSTQSGEGEGDVWVALSHGSGFTDSMVWHSWFCIEDEVCRVADVNGDGRDDIMAFVRSNARDNSEGDVWVALSTGSGFAQSYVWHNWFCVGEEICETGDFNGDGRDDIAAFVRSTQRGDGEGDVWIALSSGSEFGASYVGHSWFCIRKELCRTGDVNGDGRNDLIAFVRDGGAAGDVWISMSNGTGFQESYRASWSFCRGNDRCEVGDFNGDRLTDIMVLSLYSRHSGPTLTDVQFSQNGGFGNRNAIGSACAERHGVCAIGDFNGDRLDDVAWFLRNQRGDATGDVLVSLTYSFTPPPQQFSPGVAVAPPNPPSQPPSGGNSQPPPPSSGPSTAALFIPSGWSIALSASVGSKSMMRDTQSLTVTDTSSGYYYYHNGSELSYVMFGSAGYTLILDTRRNAGGIDYSVTLANFTTVTPQGESILYETTPGTAFAPPVVMVSPGSGEYFAIFSSNGLTINNLNVYRSDNGSLVCAGPGPFQAQGETRAGLLGNQIVIYYTDQGGNRSMTCPL